MDEAVPREWLVNIGGCNAFVRTAHLLCELYVRMETVALASRQAMHLPMTQIDLAEALGLTPVHVNRMLILRDRADQRIYIFDVNKTDVGPIIALHLWDERRSISHLANALLISARKNKCKLPA